MVTVTADDLVKGMWFALESCAEGLEAARDLLRGGKYARSVALTMAARDELGKSWWLRDLWKRVQAGDVVTLEEVRVVCGGHERVRGQRIGHIEKQAASQITVSIRGTAEEPAVAAMRRVMRAVEKVQALWQTGAREHDPAIVAAYAERDAVEADFQTETQAIRERMPTERKRLADRGLYVDVAVEKGEVCWKRPSEIGADEAKIALEEALNDYGLVRHNLEPGIVEHNPDGPALAAALAAWPDKPRLPSMWAC